MTKIAFLGNSHSDMGLIAKKFNLLLQASDLQECQILDCESQLQKASENILFESSPGPNAAVEALKNKLLFQTKVNETYLDYASEEDELRRLVVFLQKSGDMPVIVYNVFSKSTISWLKGNKFQLVHVMHNNPDSDRVRFLVPPGVKQFEELYPLATPLLKEFEHGGLCDTAITVDFNSVQSIMKELHRLFV